MATKLETLKQAVGYSDKPLAPACSNCIHFTSERKMIAWVARDLKEKGEVHLHGGFGHGYQCVTSADQVPESYFQEKNLRCLKHAFAVKKLGKCNDHEFKSF